MVQVAITLTCPKTPYLPEGVTEFQIEGNFGEPDVFKPAEMTEDELTRTRELLKKFNL